MWVYFKKELRGKTRAINSLIDLWRKASAVSVYLSVYTCFNCTHGDLGLQFFNVKRLHRTSVLL